MDPDWLGASRRAAAQMEGMLAGRPTIAERVVETGELGKRGLGHHALSIAVAEGDTMADVTFGFVHDFGPAEEWVARRGGGAQLNGTPLDAGLGERRVRERLEVVGVESADPRWFAARAEELEGTAHR